MAGLENSANITVQEIREYYIKNINESRPRYKYTSEKADELFECGLTMYSDESCFKSILYKTFAQSKINPSIALHPEQLKVIKAISTNEATIISAPTSFGKTFCVFEYIARFQPKNVVLVVPTIALSREYQSTIIKKNEDLFGYKIYTSIEDKNYDFENDKNLFILTHERAIANSNYEKLKDIDFLVIDEVYKLDAKIEDDKTLLLNVSLYYLTNIAKKYCLLAPYIGDVINKEKLSKSPKMLYLDYSPVVNQLVYEPIFDESDRFDKTLDIVKRLQDKKTMIYIPSPGDIANFINTKLIDEPAITPANNELSNFLNWAKEEIHPSWSVVKAIEKGYAVHHGAMPLGIKDYLLSVFDDPNSGYNKLLCTSTLLEGVNINAECLIITKADRKTMSGRVKSPFNAFEFYNLVGRTGRLFKYYVGTCYYIKTPDEPLFDNKNDSKVNIEFELTIADEDIDIQINNGENSQEAVDYLNSIGISIGDYNKKIGAPMKLNTFKKIKNSFDKNFDKLKENIDANNDWQIVNIVSNMCRTKKDKRFEPTIINEVIRGRNCSTRQIIDKLINNEYLIEKAKMSPEDIIDSVIRVRNGYLEHNLLLRSKVIELLLEKSGFSEDDINKVHTAISTPIELMFALNSPERKMLRSIGVYESDLDTIINHIGSNFGDLSELKKRLIVNKKSYYSSICFISRFEIERFISK